MYVPYRAITLFISCTVLYHAPILYHMPSLALCHACRRWHYAVHAVAGTMPCMPLLAPIPQASLCPPLTMPRLIQEIWLRAIPYHNTLYIMQEIRLPYHIMPYHIMQEIRLPYHIMPYHIMQEIRLLAEQKKAHLIRMQRENTFLQRHLEMRKGVSSVYYRWGQCMPRQCMPCHANACHATACHAMPRCQGWPSLAQPSPHTPHALQPHICAVVPSPHSWQLRCGRPARDGT